VQTLCSFSSFQLRSSLSPPTSIIPHPNRGTRATDPDCIRDLPRRWPRSSPHSHSRMKSGCCRRSQDILLAVWSDEAHRAGRRPFGLLVP
jgi:hypothetical protein